MPRFQIQSQQISNGRVLLNAAESHHAKTVLRLKPGDRVELLDGRGDVYAGKVTGERSGRVEIAVEAGTKRSGDVSHHHPQAEIDLAVSVIKPDRMELLIQKACEFGVSSIFPVRSARSVVKLNAERWQAKTGRWRKIAAESCKQCGLPKIPAIADVADLAYFMEHTESYGRVLIPTLAVKTESLYDTLKQNGTCKTLVLIGPEGDFSESEVESARRLLGAVPVSLGPLVLRTETAAWYALSALNFYFREVHPEGERRE